VSLIRPPRESTYLCGHQAPLINIVGLHASNQLPHALLLVGRPGIGKRTFAYQLAKLLLAASDEITRTDDASHNLSLRDDHHAFRKVAQGTHPDFWSIDPREQATGIITIDEIRTLKTFFQKKSVFGSMKIAVIANAQWMNRSAAHALLKLLEEPPAKAMIIITTEELESIPATLRSRCRIQTLTPLSEAEILRYTSFFPDLAQHPRFSTLMSLGEGCPGLIHKLYAQDVLGLFDQTIHWLTSVIGHRTSTDLGIDSKEKYDSFFYYLMNTIERLISFYF